MIENNFQNDETERFVDAVNFLRDKKRVKLIDVTTSLGTYKTLISELKNGKSKVRLEWINALCEIYGVSKDYILHGAGGVMNYQGSGKSEDVIQDGNINSYKSRIKVRGEATQNNDQLKEIVKLKTENQFLKEELERERKKYDELLNMALKQK